jgi:hypothetical protein
MIELDILKKCSTNISSAVLSLRPNAQFLVRGDCYEGIEWLEKSKEEGGQTQPTKEEVIAEMERLQAEYEYYEYQRLRAKEYPSFADQFDLLYHGGYDAWKTEIDKVKQKYPKP